MTEKALKNQLEINDAIKLAEKNQATPKEAFKAPKDKNKEDRILSASIALALSAKTEFELMSYRVHSPQQFTYNLVELINKFNKVKTENS